MERDVLFGEGGDVDAGIALPRDVEGVRLVLGPDLEELLDGLEVQLGDHVVSPGRVVAVHVGEAYLGGRLDVEHIGVVVPGILVADEQREGVREDEGPVLVEGAEQAGAAGASVEPEQQGRSRVLVAVLREEEVMHVLVGLGVQVPRVPRLVVHGVDLRDVDRRRGVLAGGQAQQHCQYKEWISCHRK